MEGKQIIICYITDMTWKSLYNDRAILYHHKLYIKWKHKVKKKCQKSKSKETLYLFKQEGIIVLLFGLMKWQWWMHYL